MQKLIDNQLRAGRPSDEKGENVKKAELVVRVLMGLIFFVFGLNGFLNFIPMEPPKEEMLAVMGGLFGIKYMLPLVKGIEVVVGAALLTNKFVPLALTVISPIIVNIFLIHAIYAPEGLPMAIFVVVANIFLAYSHKDAFKGVLKA